MCRVANVMNNDDICKVLVAFTTAHEELECAKEPVMGRTLLLFKSMNQQQVADVIWALSTVGVCYADAD